MQKIEFIISEPHFENHKFSICIDKVDYKNEKIESKFIHMYKIFWYFELPKLGIRRDNKMSSKDVEAIKWLKSKANEMKDKYEKDWENQPDNFYF